LNVTVLVSNTLRTAVDGRTRLDLGLPPQATLGELMETLLKLYPKLYRYLVSDRSAEHSTLSLWPASPQGKRSGRPGLRDGLTLCLTAPRPLTGARARSARGV
jgi:hypothetical protein